jgi:hypothetical protein
MPELVFALTFRGRAGPKAGSTARQARTTAPSQTVSTVLTPHGVETRIDPVPGAEAILESEVERFPDGSFVETGIITYGAAGAIAFSTVGRGVVGPSPVAGWVNGAVIWTVTSGTGRFSGAEGMITSNFTVSATGEVVDNHFARLYLPE